MKISPCTSADVADWSGMRLALWPDEDADQLRTEAARMAAAPEPDICNLIARAGDGTAIGFVEASVRRDYVNGCDTSPVAFVEGIFVLPGHRGQAHGRALAEAVAAWARAQGLAELASDALLDNTASHAFHAAIGFAETERVVYFRKPL